ncbi:acyl-CoA dehydrogenase family protein [Streptomyces dangxiongensis]|uniref:Acyl-CoA dehydrogenase family protein n=1 Tax=Streptomyces dangxiongensis TaxID=1442032 RepID=A0A3G2J8S3_9ACTN|nr:acyl-CoA dehydrogenase family protein [Streptomyces dangxiongensis]AYN38680.1 acyl-CoA dehydrogenase family protein [Streptomyces dangxiongensis]
MEMPHSPTGDWARERARRVAEPTAADRDRERRWDPRLFAELAAAGHGPGLIGPLVPRDLGGGGLSATQTVALLAGLGEGARDPGLALSVGVHAVLATVPLRAFGSPRQRQRYLPRMASGEWIGALSLQQTQGASVAPAVTARPAAEGSRGWVLTGELDLVAGAPVAHHFLVIAAHDDGGRTAFVVDRATPGLRVGEAGPAAMATCPWGRLVLDDCAVPDTAVLGTVGGAAGEAEPLLAVLDWVFSSAPWLGLIRALTRDAVEGARERRLFGRPLHHDQSVRFTLADLAARCELAEGMLYRAAEQFDSGARPSHRDAAAARLFVADAVRTVTDAAARLSGPLGLDSGHLIGRAHRDALFFAGTGGGTEVLRPVIAASLLDLGRPC